MNIIVNGKDKNVSEGITITALLEEMDIEPEGVVVEVNLEIIRGTDRNAHVLKENDSLEVLHFVGGG